MAAGLGAQKMKLALKTDLKGCVYWLGGVCVTYTLKENKAENGKLSSHYYLGQSAHCLSS